LTTFTTKNVNLSVNQPDSAIVTRLEKGLATLAIPSGPFMWHLGIVLGGQLQCKLDIAV